MARNHQDNGLTLREDRFATCIAIGMEQVEAYRKCFVTRGRSPEAISQAAYRMAHKPLVRVRAETFLKEAKTTDLQKAGEWMADLLDGIDKAKADKNWTAFAALKRLSGQAIGTLNEVVTLRAEQSLSDETLVKQLAKGDPSLAPKLAVLLGGKRNRGEVLSKPAAEGGV